ncbi:MAG: PepSY-associated TM helix domain-containing protein [Bacteroidales bacterium]
MRKIMRKIHLWLSIPFGIIIAVICLSGSVLIFEKEVTEWINKDILTVNSVSDQVNSMDLLMQNAERELKKGQKITSVSISDSPDATYRFNLSSPKRAFISVDPYSGAVLGIYERSPFFMFFFRLHRWLLDSVKPDGAVSWGRVIVGSSTLVFSIILLTGIFIWIPKNKRSLTNRLSVCCSKGIKRFVYDSHVSLGVYAALFLLIMSLTGPTWSFGWYKEGFYKLFGASQSVNALPAKSVEKGEKVPSEAKFEKPDYQIWDQLIGEFQKSHANYRMLTISAGSVIVQYSHWGNQRASDTYKFNQNDGKITDFVAYDDTSRAAKLRGWIYTLHTGEWGGMFSKFLYLIIVLIGFSLPLTGSYIWFSRLNKKR